MSLPPLTPDQQVKPRHFELRMSVLFAMLFIPGGVHLPYFPLWLETAGFSANDIAVILAVPLFVRVTTTPLITALADRAGDRTYVLIATVAASLFLSLGYFFSTSYWWVLLLSVALGTMWAPHVPLADSLALSGVRRFGSDYSRMRMWGSASFLSINLLAGALLARTGPSIVPLIMSIGLACTLVAALLAPRLGRPRVPSPLSATGIQQSASTVFSARFLWLAGGAGVIISSHGFNYGFSSIYWASLGIGETAIGVLWAWGVVVEVIIFIVSTRLLGRLSPAALLMAAGLGAIFRWVVFPLIWPAGLGVPGFFAIQSLHAMSTGLVLLGVQKLVAECIPDHRFGAAQGMIFFANGFAMASVTLISGILYERFGAGGFFVMAGVALLGTLMLWRGMRLAPQLR